MIKVLSRGKVNSLDKWLDSFLDNETMKYLIIHYLDTGGNEFILTTLTDEPFELIFNTF